MNGFCCVRYDCAIVRLLDDLLKSIFAVLHLFFFFAHVLPASALLPAGKNRSPPGRRLLIKGILLPSLRQQTFYISYITPLQKMVEQIWAI